MLELPNIIQDTVHKIAKKSETLKEKINNLSNRVHTQEQGLIKAHSDIETLFKSMSNLRSTCASNNNTCTRSNLMEIENNESTLNENCVVISNLPDHERDEEDVLAVYYVGFSLSINGVQIKNLIRTESKGERPGNVIMELDNLESKIQILRKN